MGTNSEKCQPDAMPQKASTGGRVFKSSIKRLSVVTKEMWQQIEAAARVPRKGRRYPEIIEAPDGLI